MDNSKNFEKKLIQLRNHQKKMIDSCDKILTSSIKDLNKELPKFRKGLNQVQKFEEEKMSIGIDGVAKKRKSLLRSLRALGEFIRLSQSELKSRLPEESIDLDEVKMWKYEDFKEWLRNYSKLINNIDKEKSKADKIMGLDFALKKRPATSHFDKLKQTRDLLRDLFLKEFSLIKILEDLTRLQTEVNDLELLISNKENEFENLKRNLQELKNKISKLQEKHNKSENEGEIKKFRQAKIKFKEVELEIGHLINPYKKIFREYSRMEGSSTYILGSARSYEDHTVETFLEDSENEFQQLKDIMNEIITNGERINIKANLKNRCSQLVQRIENGKIMRFKDDYLTFKDEVEKFSKNSSVVEALEYLEKLNSEINNLNSDSDDLISKIENVELDIKEHYEQIKSRENRFNESYEEGINFVLVE